MLRKIKLKYIFTIITFIAFAFLSQLLLLHSHMLFPIDDMQFQVRRINEIIMSLNHLRISPYEFNQFNGSAVMAFYPYITLLPIFIIYQIIKSKIVIIYLFFILNTFISLLVSFFSSLGVSKNFWTSYVFSIIYSLSPILMGYDLGMTIAVSYLPLVIFGFIHLLNDGHYYELSFGITLMMYSHILSTIIAISFIILLLLINYNKWDLQLFKNILKSTFIEVCITSIVWIPMIFISSHNKINVPAPKMLQGLPNSEIIKSFFGGADEMGLGTFVIISIFISLVFWRKFNKLDKQFYALSVIAILICSKLFPWNLLANIKLFSTILSHFQFTYRFLIVPILLLDYIFSIIITKLINKNYVSYTLICCSIVLAIGLRFVSQEHAINKYSSTPTFTLAEKYKPNYFRIMNNNQLNKFVKYDPDNLSKLSAGTDYYPKESVKRANYINNTGRHKGICDNSYTINVYHTGYNKIHFYNKDFIQSMSLPIVCYNKEHLNLSLDGKKIPHKSNKDNMVTISRIQRGRHNLSIKYVPNIKLLILKICMFSFGLLYVIIDYFKNKITC